MRRGWGRAVAALAGLGVALAAAAGPAVAQGGGDGRGATGIHLDVEAGYGGAYLPGRRVPVHVTVRADRLVRGTLEVALPDRPATWSLAVEVPGSGVNDFVVVVPTPPTTEVRDVMVRLTGAGEPVRATGDLEPLRETELVGLLPEVTPPDLPAPLDLLGGTASARFVALDPAHLELGGVLDPIGTVVAGPDELGRLPAAARAEVLDWVDRGGRLVVDAAPGTPVAGLPDEWLPGERGRRAAGLGEVRAAGGAAAAGRWGEVVEPTPTVGTPEVLETAMLPEAGV